MNIAVYGLGRIGRLFFRLCHGSKTKNFTIKLLADRYPRVTPVGELSLSRVLLCSRYNKDRREILRGKRKAFFEKVSSVRSCKRSQNATCSTTGSTRGYLCLKRSWHGIATRYVKRLSSFVAFVHLACAMDWLRLITSTRVDVI